MQDMSSYIYDVSKSKLIIFKILDLTILIFFYIAIKSTFFLHTETSQEKLIIIFNEIYYSYFKSYSSSDIRASKILLLHEALLCHRTIMNKKMIKKIDRKD